MSKHIIFLSVMLAARSSLAGTYLIPVTEENLKPIELKTEHSEGKGTCLEPTFGQLQEGAECFEYYQQGPCKKREVLVCNSLSGFGECVPDLCAKENCDHNKLKSDKNILAEDANSEKKVKKTFAPLNGSGKCLELGSKGCNADSEQNAVFTIDSKSKIPVCQVVEETPDVVTPVTLLNAVHEIKIEDKKDEVIQEVPESQEQANF